MRKSPLPVLALALAAPGAALAQVSISSEIGSTGIAATQARLTALPVPDATERFALGGLAFLGAIEHALQVRYATDINGDFAEQSGIPLLRLPLPPNPDATPFAAESVAALFEQITADMAEALEWLDTIDDEDNVGLVINTADLWFDINSNGQRDLGEDALAIAGFALSPAWEEPSAAQAITVRFDTSDAAWLSAYAHLLSGISESVLALDPTTSIERVFAARDAMNDLSPAPVDPDGWFSVAEIADIVDLTAIFVHAIEQQPDVAHSRAAHGHFLGMIEDNRTFWFRVAAERDNEMEWIPNKYQVSALPIPFPPDLAPRWQAVLQEAEQVLNGELLLPVWRMGAGAGLNLEAFMQNPPPLDVMGLIQGETFVPYLEEGPLMRGDALRQFEQLVGGDAGLYMVVLN